MTLCTSCTARKAKQKNVPKESEHVKADKPGARIFLDIAMIKGEKMGCMWAQKNKKVWFVRCDNTGENRSLEKRAQSSNWKMSIDFQYTACAMPQQNHLAELGFALL
eukprot:11468005-Ditylum_brightwellii.AAC.1